MDRRRMNDLREAVQHNRKSSKRPDNVGKSLGAGGGGPTTKESRGSET